MNSPTSLSNISEDISKGISETNYSSNELDIFDEKIKKLKSKNNKQLAIIHALIVGFMAGVCSKKYSAKWGRVALLFTLVTFILNKVTLR